MSDTQISLDKSKNADYFKWSDGYTDIIIQMTNTNNEIVDFGGIKFVPFFQKKGINKLKDKVQILDVKIAKWIYGVRLYLLQDKKFVFEDGQNPDLNFTHYITQLRDMKNEVFLNHEIVCRNYSNLPIGYKNQKNYLLTLFGLFLALVGLFGSIL